MKNVVLFFFLSLLTPLSFAQPKDARVALVIGNSAYKSSPLRNPVNDAGDMTARLKSFGFIVIQRNNLTTKQIGSTLREFRSKLTPGSVALVFYAGHGVTIKGKNYFPTIDAEINGEEDVPTQSLGTEQIMDVLAEAKTRLNLVFLDACRDNPYAQSFRSTTRGLSRENAPSGTLISFATKPGSVAADGVGRNGLYTSVLLEQMKDSNQPIEQVLKRVVSGVRMASNNKQEPWMEGSIEGDFCFGICGQNISAPLAKSAELQIETKFWGDIKVVGNKQAFELYLKKYPNGSYVELANLMLQKISTDMEANSAKTTKDNGESGVHRLKIDGSPPAKELTSLDPDNQRWKFNYYTMENPLLSRVTGSSKVMQVQLTVMTHYDDRVIANVKAHHLALRAGVLDVMRQATESELSQPGFRKALAENVRLTINSLLEKYEGFGGIEEVMFTEFVVQ